MKSPHRLENINSVDGCIYKNMDSCATYKDIRILFLPISWKIRTLDMDLLQVFGLDYGCFAHCI